MKKFFALILTISFLFNMLTSTNINVFADEATTEILTTTESVWEYDTYTYDNLTPDNPSDDISGIVVTNYSGSQSDVYIPGSFQVNGVDVPVIKIGDNIFKDNTAINSVTLSENIKVIGSNAFSNATNLVCIVTNESLSFIGEYAFSNCSAFNSIILYDDILAIGTNAFSNCNNLTIYCNKNSNAFNYAYINNINYQILNDEAEPTTRTIDGVTYFVNNGKAAAVSYDATIHPNIIIPSTVDGCPVTDISTAFKGTALKSIVIPGTITHIANSAFYECSALESVILKDGVTSIGGGAFYFCDKLSNIVLPDSVCTIGSSAFYCCQKLTSITIPKHQKNIGAYTFFGCTNLYQINIPVSVESIGDYAFSGCANISEINIPVNVKSIGKFAFSSCTSLSDINFESGITSIDTCAFDNCTLLESVYLPDTLVNITAKSFPLTTVLIVEPDSQQASFALQNDLLYFINEQGKAPQFYTVDGIKYYISDEEAIAIACTNSSVTNVTIPKSIEGFPVTKLLNTFNNFSNLKSVILPDTIECIGTNAFYNCKQLVSVNIPNKIKKIGNYAFYECYNLTSSINIPYGATHIGYRAFYYCMRIPSINLPDSVTYIGSEAFSHCSKITTINIPKNITKINSNTFYSCSRITKITIPDNVTEIGGWAFGYCYALTDVQLPKNLTSIGNNAFYNCTKLTSVILPNNIVSFGEYVFAYCESLQSINIPSNLDFIASYTFDGCSSLETITIPEGIVSIGGSAFSGCTNLKTVNLPDSLTTIGYDAFLECNSLSSVRIPTGVKKMYTSSFTSSTTLIVTENSYAHSFAWENNLLYFVSGSDEEQTYITDNNIKYCVINGNAIAIGCENPELTSVTLPSTVNNYPVTEIRGAFQECYNLRSVILPPTLQIIGAHSFYDCGQLGSIVIPENVTRIENNAFENCYFLYEVSLPQKLISIGDSAFLYCMSLSEITLPDSLSHIGESAFSGCMSLPDITIPSGVENILYGTFSGCEGFTEIILHDKIKTIGGGAFSGCYNLNSIYIPDGVTEIGDSAFHSCSALSEIQFPKELVHIGKWAFLGCTSLEQVILSDKVTYIGEAAFHSCTDLNTIIMSKKIEHIGNRAFCNCSKISTVVLSDTLAEMYNESFPITTILCVPENSYAHTFSANNDLLYFAIQKTINPEILYGTNITGTITDSAGRPMADVSVDVLYDDGTVKETVLSDENGKYAFTYMEVGRYTIRAISSQGAVGTESISIKRKNVFEVFVAGNTDVVINTSNSVSGTVSENIATVTLSDENGNVIASNRTTSGLFTFNDIPNGTYVIKAESGKGIAVQEITVFNEDITGVNLVIIEESSSITGLVVDEYENNRIWASVSLYNSDGIAVSNTKTDQNSIYSIKGLENGEYKIVITSNQMDKHPEYDYDRSVVLKGYGYVSITTPDTYTADTIVVYNETQAGKDEAVIEGKVTAEGSKNNSEVILTDVFRNEIARTTTKSNGKYKFVNVPDGMYFITGTSDSDGMGRISLIVVGGQVHGETNITIHKSDKIKNLENYIEYNIPYCRNREDALLHKDKILEAKTIYDKLSDKEKAQFSKDYLDRLNKLLEWISQTEYVTNDTNVTIEGGGLLASQYNIENNDTIQVNITVDEIASTNIDADGVKTDDDFINQIIEDTAKDKVIGQYYDISMQKGTNGKYKDVDDIHKDTDTTCSLQITMPIPEEYLGHKHYSLVHIHNGEATTLIDLDDNPSTITFNTSKFSTFVLCYSDKDVAEIIPDEEPILNLSSEQVSVTQITASCELILASYNGRTLIDTKIIPIDSDVMLTIADLEGFTTDNATVINAFLWENSETLVPLCESKSVNLSEI